MSKMWSHLVHVIHFRLTSGLAPATVGADCEDLGAIPLHQQCKGHDHIQLLADIDGDTFSAVRRTAAGVAMLARHVPGEISCEFCR